MKTKFSKTLFTAVLTSAMALGTGTCLAAQDQPMDKPSAGLSVQTDQGASSQYNAPQYTPEQSGPQDVAPPPPQDQDAYQDQAQAIPPPASRINASIHPCLPSS